MKLILKEKGSTHILVLEGKVETGDIEGLSLFLKGLARREPRDLVLDFSVTELLVSAAIGTLLADTEPFRGAGKRVVMLQPSEKVAAVLKRCGVYEAIPVYPNRDAALAALEDPLTGV